LSDRRRSPEPEADLDRSTPATLPVRARRVGDPAGRLEAIWIKRAHGGVMDASETAVLQARKGIVGNADWGGWRQVTIIERERWEAVTAGLGVTLDPAARRANLMVSGIDLESSRDKTLRIGGVRIKLVNETAPCNRMEEAQPGLEDALRPRWGGGAFGYVVDDGEINVGDEVCWVEYEEFS
jgi:MOSC domain-containing protein YiiM